MYKIKYFKIMSTEYSSFEYLSAFAKMYLYLCMKLKSILKIKELSNRNPKSMLENIFDVPEPVNAIVASSLSFVIFLFFNQIVKIFIQSQSYLLLSLLFLYPSYLFFKNLVSNEIRKIQRDSEQILYYIDMNLRILEKSLPKNQDPLLYFLKRAPNYPFFDKNIKMIFLRMNILITFGNSPKDAIQRIPPIFFPITQYFMNYLSQSSLGFHSDPLIELATVSEMKEENKRLDTSLSLFFFSGTLVPIGITYLMVLGVINTQELGALNLLFIILLQYQFLRLKLNSVKLFGITRYSSSINLKEMDQFIEFGFVFTKFLSHFTPQLALIKTLESNRMIHNIQFNNSLKYPFKLSQIFFSETISPIAQLFDSILDINSQNAENILKNALEILKNHNILMKEKLTIIKAEQFKARLFNYLIPIILSILTGISLMFSSLIGPYQDLFINSNSGSALNIEFFSLIPLISIEKSGIVFWIVHLLFQSFDIFYSILLFGKLVEINRPASNALFGLIVYLSIITIIIIIIL